MWDSLPEHVVMAKARENTVVTHTQTGKDTVTYFISSDLPVKSMYDTGFQFS